MKIEGTNLLVRIISAFSDSSRWAPEGREISHKVVVIDRFHCSEYITIGMIPFVWLQT